MTVEDLLTAGAAALSAAAGGLIGWVAGQSQPKKVNILVTQALLIYVGSLDDSVAGTPNYVALFDVNHDGIIDIYDVTFFAENMGLIVSLNVP